MLYSLDLQPILLPHLPFALQLLISAVVGYLLGSVGFAYIVARAMKGIDITQYGSGNPGTSNVLRVVGKTGAALTLLGDALKGYLAVLLGGLVAGGVGMLLAAACVMVGHMFPLFYHFKGGKTVATAAGVMLALDWRIALTAIGVFVLLLVITKYISLSSIVASVTVAVSSLFYTKDISLYIICFLVAIFIIFKHRSNIKRLLAGTENKISFKSKKE